MIVILEVKESLIRFFFSIDRTMNGLKNYQNSNLSILTKKDIKYDNF